MFFAVKRQCTNSVQSRLEDAKRGSGFVPASSQKDFFQAGLFAEVALQQTLKAVAVAGLIAGHFVHGVMDRVEVLRLGELCKLGLA